MDIARLRDVQSRERTTDSLQELPDTFYEDVASYIAELKAERERAADEADDPFADPDVSRLTDEIQTAEQVAESLYERRVGKIVKQASFAAAGMGDADDGLTTEERALYDDLVGRIEENKTTVLDVLAGESDPGTDEGESAAPESGVDAASLMGEDVEDPVSPPERPDRATERSPPASESEDPTPPTERADAGTDPTDPVPGAGSAGADRPGASDTEDADTEPVEGLDSPDEERETVRITKDVGEIFGVDERTYELESEDVVSLPEVNAGALVERDAATRLE